MRLREPKTTAIHRKASSLASASHTAMPMLLDVWIMMDNSKRMKMEQFYLPTQLLAKVQWWSNYSAHRLQEWQWQLLEATVDLHYSHVFSSMPASWQELSLSLGSDGSLTSSLMYSTIRHNREIYAKAMITCMAGDQVLSIWGTRLKLRISIARKRPIASTCEMDAPSEQQFIGLYAC